MDAKMQKEVDRELQEANALANKSKQARFHTEALKLLFLLYFNVLKNEPESPILLPVLKGIGKYSYLVNIDFQYDLFQQLNVVLTTVNLPVVTSLQCIATAFDTLRSHEDTLNVDLKQFYVHFYALLNELTTESLEDCLPLLRKCLQFMISDQQQMSFERLAAFAKRIATLALQLPFSASLALLLELHQVCRRHRRVQILLCGSDERGGSGCYLPHVDDPEHAGASASTLWETCLLAVFQASVTFVQ